MTTCNCNHKESDHLPRHDHPNFRQRPCLHVLCYCKDFSPRKPRPRKKRSYIKFQGPYDKDLRADVRQALWMGFSWREISETYGESIVDLKERAGYRTYRDLTGTATPAVYRR